MFVSCWSAKGGAGTTVVAASLGLVLSERPGPGVLLVDLAGDLPAVLGIAEPDGPGVAAWAAAGSRVPADALTRIEVPVRPGVALLPRGAGGLVDDEDRAALLAGLLASDDRTVVVDCGTLGPGSAVVPVAAAAPASLLVTRPCYLALRRAVAAPLRPTGVVLVDEPGRALDRGDVEAVVGAPVTATVALDAGVARAVDAGLLASRLPRGLHRALRAAA
jgi:MinD-like ATPase involved in chromosome partitioning or flagellar assembly